MRVLRYAEACGQVMPIHQVAARGVFSWRERSNIICVPCRLTDRSAARQADLLLARRERVRPLPPPHFNGNTMMVALKSSKSYRVRRAADPARPIVSGVRPLNAGLLRER